VGVGQVEEAPQVVLEGAVVAAGDGLGGDLAGERVGGELVARAAVEVARELVEQDQQRQRPLGGLDPAVVFAARGGMVGGLVLQADGLVERRVLLEPAAGACLAPEVDDVGGIGGHEAPSGEACAGR
jgi:hypothetical protein